MADSTKKSVLTPDDIQAIADLTGMLVSSSEERLLHKMQELITASEERMFGKLQQEVGASEERMTGKMQQLIRESEERSMAYFASKEEMKSLIRDTVGQVVEEKIVENIGNLPTREEFFSRSDRAAEIALKNQQELLILSHQYLRHDEQISVLEKDVLQLKKKQKKSPLA